MQMEDLRLVLCSYKKRDSSHVPNGKFYFEYKLNFDYKLEIELLFFTKMAAPSAN